MELSIPCPHESGEVKDRKLIVPDHHPLLKEEIAALLRMAQSAEHVANLALIQRRLNQGIVGMVCPRPNRGVLADKILEMYNLLVKERYRGGNPKLVEKFYRIMTS